MRLQVRKFFSHKLKRKFRRKPICVPLDLFVKPLGRDLVERGEVGIENNAVAAQFEKADRGREWLRVKP